MKNCRKAFPDSTKVQWANASGALVASGQVVRFGAEFGVADTDIANTSPASFGTVTTRGEFVVAKPTATALTAGQAVGWDFTNARITTDTSAGVFGVVADAAAADATSCNVLLNQAPRREFLQRIVVNAAQNTANQVDVDCGFPVATAFISATLLSTAGVQRPATVTTNPGGSAPNTVRIAEANLAENEIVMLRVVQL